MTQQMNQQFKNPRACRHTVEIGGLRYIHRVQYRYSLGILDFADLPEASDADQGGCAAVDSDGRTEILDHETGVVVFVICHSERV